MWRASVQRKKFRDLLWLDKLSFSSKVLNRDFDIISFSGKRDFEEQVLSICSFLFYVGTPGKWTVYSDGSYSQKEKDYLVGKFSFLDFKEWNYNKNLDDNEILKNYLEVCHLSKKLRVILGHNYERQTVYIDSDVVFYRNADAYFNSEMLKKDFWYLADTNWGSIDRGGINDKKDMFELNSGLMILNKEFDFTDVLDYLNSLNSRFGYFSEQSSFNYAFKKQKAKLLDPRQFIVNTEDQFDFSMTIESAKVAFRHYVNPVRHKMWQKGWKWHFKN